MLLTGSICLSNIPKECIKKVQRRDGSVGYYLNVAVLDRKEPSQFGDTHFITCAPKKEERKEGVNYIFGDLKEYKPIIPSTEEINNAPAVAEDAPLDEDTGLPF